MLFLNPTVKVSTDWQTLFFTLQINSLSKPSILSKVWYLSLVSGKVVAFVPYEGSWNSDVEK